MTAAHQDIGTNPRRPFMSGDTLPIIVAVTQDDEDFSLETVAAIRWQLYVSNGAAFSGAAVVEKSLGSGIEIALPAQFTITLDPTDTEELAGLYYHEAEITMGDGAVYTVLTGKLQITADAIE